MAMEIRGDPPPQVMGYQMRVIRCTMDHPTLDVTLLDKSWFGVSTHYDRALNAGIGRSVYCAGTGRCPYCRLHWRSKWVCYLAGHNHATGRVDAVLGSIVTATLLSNFPQTREGLRGFRITFRRRGDSQYGSTYPEISKLPPLYPLPDAPDMLPLLRELYGAEHWPISAAELADRGAPS